MLLLFCYGCCSFYRDYGYYPYHVRYCYVMIPKAANDQTKSQILADGLERAGRFCLNRVCSAWFASKMQTSCVKRNRLLRTVSA